MADVTGGSRMRAGYATVILLAALAAAGVAGYWLAPDARIAAADWPPAEWRAQFAAFDARDLDALPWPVEPEPPDLGPGPPVDLDAVDLDRDLHGVVVTEDGRPIPGALLQTVTYPYIAIHAVRSGPSTRSAADGRFAIPLGPLDVVALRVSAPGYGSIERRWVRAGEQIRVALPPRASLTVSVVDRSDRPIAGARVQVLILGRKSTVAFRGGVSAADGTCTFPDLPALGRASIVAIHLDGHAGFGPAVSLAPSDQRNVRVVAELRGNVSGVIRDAQTGRPVPGAHVRQYLDLPGAVTGRDGRYELGVTDEDFGPVSGDFMSLVVTAAGYVDTFVLAKPRRRIDFRLERCVAVAGRVVDAIGVPVPGASIGLERVDRPAPKDTEADLLDGVPQSSPRGAGSSGNDGRFLVVGLQRGETHRLRVVAPPHAPVERELNVAAAAANTIDLGDIALPQGRRVAGKVLDEHDRPVTDAYVTLPGMGTSAGSRSVDDVGRFRLVGVPPGDYELSVERSGRLPLVSRITVAPNADLLDLEFRFGPARPLVVWVEADAGGPVRGAWIHINAGRRSAGSAYSDHAGRAQFSLDAGRVTVSASGSWMTGEYGHDSKDVGPDVEEVRLVLPRQVKITGRVIGTDGRALADASLDAYRNGDDVGFATTDKGGAFELDVPDGPPVDLVLSGYLHKRAGLRDPTPPFGGFVQNVSPGAKDVTITAHVRRATRALKVRVLTPNGWPAPRSSVDVESVAYAAHDEGRADADGIAHFTALEWVPYRVVARPPDDHLDARGWIESERISVVPSGQEISVALRRGWRAAGVVLSPDGRRVSGAVVRALVRGEPVAVAESDWEGRFAFWVPAEKGTVEEIEGEAAQHGAILHARFDRPRLGDLGYPLWLASCPTAPVTGVVLAPDGTPAVRARVSFEAFGSTYRSAVDTDDAGRFSFVVDAERHRALAVTAEDATRKQRAYLHAVRPGAGELTLRLVPIE